jgi:hypothetical protein
LPAPVMHFYSGSPMHFLSGVDTYNGFPPIETNCMVRSSILQEFAIDIVETPNGKAFILENDKADTNKWYLNHQVAVKISNEPEPCYRNNEVQICF